MGTGKGISATGQGARQWRTAVAVVVEVGIVEARCCCGNHTCAVLCVYGDGPSASC